MTQSDIKRLSLILLFMPFALWILLLIVLPHIGMGVLALREKVAPRVYEFGFGNFIEFLHEPIYWNTLLRTGSTSPRSPAGAPAARSSCSASCRSGSAT